MPITRCITKSYEISNNSFGTDASDTSVPDVGHCVAWSDEILDNEVNAISRRATSAGKRLKQTEGPKSPVVVLDARRVPFVSGRIIIIFATITAAESVERNTGKVGERLKCPPNGIFYPANKGGRRVRPRFRYAARNELTVGPTWNDPFNEWDTRRRPKNDTNDIRARSTKYLRNVLDSDRM